jgi:hypothetical protein
MKSFCEMCSDSDESVHHVVLLCHVARRFWNEVKKLTGVRILDLNPLYVGNGRASCRYLPRFFGCYANMWRLDFVDWMERSSSWPQGLGAGGDSSVYIIHAGGAVLTEDASTGGEDKKTREVATPG